MKSVKKLTLLSLGFSFFLFACDAYLYGAQHHYMPFLVKKISPLDGLNEKKLTALLKDIDQKDWSKGSLKADISYLFIDLKFDGKNLKILEFGEGKNGGFRTFDAIFEKGGIWAVFWSYLGSLGLPVWYVGPQPSNLPINKIGITLREKISWDNLLKIGGRACSSFQELERDPLFKEAKNVGVTEHDKLKTYKGVIVFKYRDDREPIKLRALEDFRKKYPDFLVIDRVSRPYAANKRLANVLFQDHELEKYRPKCKIYPKEYHAGLAQQIIDDLKCEAFVIKPVNSGMSNGVIMLEKQELDIALRRILRPGFNDQRYNYTFNHRPTDTQTYGYWIGDHNASFIVEEYVPSKVITVNGKEYDPTIRVVFVLDHDQSKVTFTYLTGWWKIPPQSLSDSCDLTEKHVSKFRGDLKKLSPLELKINAQDLKDLKRLLQDSLPKVYAKMLKVKHELES